MDSFIRFVGTLVVALVLSCAINSLLMEWHIVPKMAAGRTGVLVTDQPPSTLKAAKDDVQYGDFWYSEKVPSDAKGFCSGVSSKDGKMQVGFPSSF